VTKQRIGLILVPGFQVTSLSPLTVFEAANFGLQESRYEVAVLSEGGAPVPSSFGMTVTTLSLESGHFDTILVAADIVVYRPTPRLKAFLRNAAKTTRRVASICLGAFTLGEAGLLDGRRATTHWKWTGELQKRFPRANVEADRLFTEDHHIWTSAGQMAAIDMALAMVERDVGSEVARLVAEALVVERRRPGGESQHSVLLDLKPKSDQVHAALAYARNNLDSKLTIESLARAASLSPRQFSRIFRAETGQTPAKAVEGLRLEAARLMTEQSSLTIEVIASETGFGDPERMRRAFLRGFENSPQALRRLARASFDSKRPQIP
jgi:transcriptional regulator GlxA family with amidase domain